MSEGADPPASLLPTVAEGDDAEALRFGERALTYSQLGDALAHAERMDGDERVAVWANELETCVAVVGALRPACRSCRSTPSRASVSSGTSRPTAPLPYSTRPRRTTPEALRGVAGEDVDLGARATGAVPAEPRAEAPAVVVYTSGTTGTPRGGASRAHRHQPRRARGGVEWTAEDVLVHGLPLFHVHGLILGCSAPCAAAGARPPRALLAPEAAAALGGEATMLFGVPTMYHRLAAEAEADAELARGVGARGCSSRARPRSPPPITRASSARPASASSSATG